MNPNINILSWNARSVRNKKEELFSFLMSQNVHICLLSETWLNKNITIKNKEFYCYRKDRNNTNGGGVAILIRKNIKHEIIPNVNTDVIENIGLKVFTTSGDYIKIYACYFPGGSAGPENTKKRKFCSDIRKLSCNNSKYLLGGDFNGRHSLWGCRRSNCWGNLLFERLDSNNLQILYPNDYTYIPSNSSKQPSTLDIFLTNIATNLSPVTVINALGSDHLPIKISLNYSCNLIENSYLDFKNANWMSYGNFLKNNLPSINLNTISCNEQIDTMVNNFTNIVTEAINQNVPRKTVKTHRSTLPTHILDMIKIRNRYRRDFKRYRNPIDHYQFKSLNKTITENIIIYKNFSWNKMLSTLNKGSTTFWKVSKILKKKYNIIPPLKQNNNIYNSQQEKCEVLAQTFSANHSYSQNLSDLTTIAEVEESLSNLNNANLNTQNSILVTPIHIQNIIKKMKIKKSPGIDKLNNMCLKALPKKGIIFLTGLINACFKLNYFPKMWKKSKIVPIKKPKKPPDIPTSYRPISLLSSVSKVLEKVIKEKLTDFIESNNILPPQQFGFRKQHNTVQPLVRIRKTVKSNFQAGKSTGMVLLDIKAAFDSVWHAGLVHKMFKLNFPIGLIKIIQSFLSGRNFCVFLGSSCSRDYDIEAGCPQGSCLSPTLYNIYTSDFPSLEGCTTSIFADDTAILSTGILAEDVVANLQLAMVNVTNYFSKWKILVNAQKTQAIYFTRKRKSCFIPSSCLKFNNDEINWENKVKYLGVMLDPKLNFKDHIPYIINKINIHIKLLYALINRNSILSLENKLIIFKVIFQSIIFYGAPVWATSAKCHLGKLQISQNKLLKLMLKLPRHFPTRRLHHLVNIEMIEQKLNRIVENFNSRCQSSDFNYISELVS